ncbi:hypothetical protein [Methylobacterium nigriterrae]|uniref:hypothetical protein n=1 Tax=Methylobacterium nigriterrae TaxID=3127512 RepID=UPI003013EF77
MTLTDIAKLIETNGPDFADRVFASLGGAHPAELFEAGPAAEEALEMLRRRRDLMIALDTWPGRAGRDRA